ncbi:MAG: DUF4263 domain-containing protein [Proteobacteria bacterium]|nr:DUF4263 domain-containing protein [Pseudomonadota bacterium]
MTRPPRSEVDEAQIVGNHKADHLYTHEWTSGEGRYLNFVIDEQGRPQTIDVELEPHARNRIKVTISFVHDRNDITKIELKKFKLYKRKGWQPCPDDETGFGNQHITLRPYSFEKLLAFLQFVSGLDIPGITQRRLALSIDGSQPLDDETKRKLRTLLARKGGSELIGELLRTGLIATEDLVNLGYRKQQLALFERMLASTDDVTTYQREHRLREDQPESAWQHFFEQNEWIFGYGLDYRFQGILQSQFHASDTDADGSQSVISDFLLGDKRFTTFVEIKTPQTLLFAGTQNRSRTWRLSGSLLDSVSQILEQKAAGLLKFDHGTLYDANGSRITQKPYDPKVILLIGHWDQLNQSADEREQETKQRTLELFRRDSRNIEIITYDELFERAKFIVEHRQRATS